jgi:hypothetical protein
MPEWLISLLSMVGGAIGVYAGIRFDMGRMTAKIEGHGDRIDRLEDKIFR